jgi:hypothetical protein
MSKNFPLFYAKGFPFQAPKILTKKKLLPERKFPAFRYFAKKSFKKNVFFLFIL